MQELADSFCLGPSGTTLDSETLLDITDGFKFPWLVQESKFVPVHC
jgi:hypothetical protein